MSSATSSTGSSVPAADKEKRAQSPTFRFRSYYPVIFHTLRNVVFGVSNDAYRKSMEGAPEDMIKHFSAGASGSFFYLSVDQRYMIKTLTKDEHRLLLRIARRYCRYMNAKRHSLICRFYGLYSIELYGHTEYIVVMNNFLRTPMDHWGVPLYRIDEIFDLKGSSINRHAKKKPKPLRRIDTTTTTAGPSLSGSAGTSSGSSGNNVFTSLRSRGTVIGPAGASASAGAADAKDSADGSTAIVVEDERMAAERARAENEAHKPVILKDNDLKKTVKIHGERAQFFIDQLASDSQFLRDQQIMDYSLLLGIHNCTERRQLDRHCNGLQQPVKNRPSIFSPKPAGGLLTPSGTANTHTGSFMFGATGGAASGPSHGSLSRPASTAALSSLSPAPAAGAATPVSPTSAAAPAVAATPATAAPSLLTGTAQAETASLLSGVPDELVNAFAGTPLTRSAAHSVAPPPPPPPGRPTSPSLAVPGRGADGRSTPGRVSVAGNEAGTLSANAAGAALAHAGNNATSTPAKSSLETSLLPVLTATPAGAAAIPLPVLSGAHDVAVGTGGGGGGSSSKGGDIALSPTRRSIAVAATDLKSDAALSPTTAAGSASPTAGNAAVAAAAAGAAVVVVAGPTSASLASGSLTPAGARVFHHQSNASLTLSAAAAAAAGAGAGAAAGAGAGVGRHHASVHTSSLEAELEGSGAVSADVIVGPGIYHFGIIDVLQQWTWQKKVEQWAKRFLACYCANYVELSAVEPGFYSDRFVAMVNRLFEK